MKLIVCQPYGCTLSEASCAARHARTLLDPRRGLKRHDFALCVGCADGAERVERLGTVSTAAAKAGVDFRGVRSASLATYVPRNGCP